MNKHIKKAIKILGSQKKLADALGVTQPFASLVLNEIKPIPPALCMKIQHATKGKVTALMLRPDVFSEIQD